MSNTPESIRVLHVDDQLDFADLAATFLEHEDDRLDVLTAASPEEGLDYLDDRDVDCVVTDYDMPGTDGIAFLETIRDEHGDLPVILFTGKGSEEIASEAISAGVTDYLQKEFGTDQYAVLANRIENAVSQRRAESKLETRVRQQRVVTDLGQRALAGVDIDTLFAEAVSAVADALGTDFAKVLEHRPGMDDLALRAGVGWQPGLVGDSSVEADRDSQAGFTLRSEAPVIVDDLGEEERFSGPDLLLDHGVVSGISVIIGEPDDPWGVLGTHSTERIRFTDEDTTFVQSVANVLASAIENERTRSELEEVHGRISDAFFALDEEWRFTFLNERAHALINPDGRELLGRNVWEEFPDAMSRTFKEEYERAMYEQEAVSFEEYYPEPLDTWFEVRAYPSETGLSVYFRDVTERKRRERELQTIRDRMEFALDATDSYVFVVDLESETETRYGVFERLHGVASADVPTLEAFYERAVHPDDREAVRRAERAVVSADESARLEQEYRTHPDHGPVRWIRSEAYVRAGDRGESELLIGLATDATEQKRHERELERQNERLEGFASVVSHDLRNPLSVAETHLALAREDCESDHLDDIERAHGRVRALTDDLLALAREGETDAAEPLDLATAVAESWRNVATADASLVTETERRIRADTTRLGRLLENLFRNSVEHGGDHVTVTVGDIPDGFFVEDDGRGIPPDSRENAFDAGYSTAPDGTGLGLNIVREVADAHGWDVRVDSGGAGGARFEITGVESAE